MIAAVMRSPILEYLYCFAGHVDGGFFMDSIISRMGGTRMYWR